MLYWFTQWPGDLPPHYLDGRAQGLRGLSVWTQPSQRSVARLRGTWGDSSKVRCWGRDSLSFLIYLRVCFILNFTSRKDVFWEEWEFGDKILKIKLNVSGRMTGVIGLWFHWLAPQKLRWWWAQRPGAWKTRGSSSQVSEMSLVLPTTAQLHPHSPWSFLQFNAVLFS